MLLRCRTGQFFLFGFELSVYMGTQPPWFLLEKEASSILVSISFVFLFPAKIVLHGIFGSYEVFGNEKTPSIAISDERRVCRSKISSWTRVQDDYSFLVSICRFTWGL